VSTGSIVETMSLASDRIYVGGRFTVIGGQNRTNLAAVDLASGAVLPFVAHTDNAVFALAATSNHVFAAGQFTTVNGQARPNLAALNPTTGQLTSWTPNPNLYLESVMVARNTVFAGGSFFTIAGEACRSFAAFPLLPPPPVIDPTSLARLGDGRFSFRFTAPEASQATVSASSNLIDWQSLGSVPVSGGSAQFTDPAAPARSLRFYRATVP